MAFPNRFGSIGYGSVGGAKITAIASTQHNDKPVSLGLKRGTLLKIYKHAIECNWDTKRRQSKSFTWYQVYIFCG